MKYLILALSLISTCIAAEKEDKQNDVPKKGMKYMHNDNNPDALDIYIFDHTLPKRKQKAYKPSNRNPNQKEGDKGYKTGSKVPGK